MRIGSKHIDGFELPRALVGGLKQGPTEEFLRRMTSECAQLYDENVKLSEALEQLEARWNEDADERNAETASAEKVESQEVVSQTRVSQRAGLDLKEPDELAFVVLATAHRTARELRESTRRDCELMLRKAASRARRLERDLERTRASTSAELEELNALKRELGERMRSALQAIIPRAAEAVSAETAERGRSGSRGEALPAAPNR